MSNSHENRERDANRDPISCAPGAHPVGTGVGAALGCTAAGAAAGTVVGAAAGAVIVGLAGKSVAEAIDPTLEDACWRDHCSGRPSIERGSTYDDHGTA